MLGVNKIRPRSSSICLKYLKEFVRNVSGKLGNLMKVIPSGFVDTLL